MWSQKGIFFFQIMICIHIYNHLHNPVTGAGYRDRNPGIEIWLPYHDKAAGFEVVQALERGTHKGAVLPLSGKVSGKNYIFQGQENVREIIL